jgi:hypothetical protein
VVFAVPRALADVRILSLEESDSVGMARSPVIMSGAGSSWALAWTMVVLAREGGSVCVIITIYHRTKYGFSEKKMFQVPHGGERNTKCNSYRSRGTGANDGPVRGGDQQLSAAISGK